MRIRRNSNWCRFGLRIPQQSEPNAKARLRPLEAPVIHQRPRMCRNEVVLTATAQNLGRLAVMKSRIAASKETFQLSEVRRQRRNDVAVSPLACIPDRFGQ